MATEISRDDMRRLARLGAERRLEELRQEEAAIRAAFPELGATKAATRGRPGRKRGRPAGSGVAAKPGATAQSARATRRRRRTMSAAQKRAVSERMKKYWAARRKAKG